MADTQMTISVPTELNNLGQLAQQIVGDLASGKNALGVISGAMPILFQEGMKVDELKAELKDPGVIMLAAVVVGGIAAQLVKWRKDKVAKAVQSGVGQAPVVQAPVTVVPPSDQSQAVDPTAPAVGDSSQA